MVGRAIAGKLDVGSSLQGRFRLPQRVFIVRTGRRLAASARKAGQPDVRPMHAQSPLATRSARRPANFRQKRCQEPSNLAAYIEADQLNHAEARRPRHAAAAAAAAAVPGRLVPGEDPLQSSGNGLTILELSMSTGYEGFHNARISMFWPQTSPMCLCPFAAVVARRQSQNVSCKLSKESRG